MTESGKSHEEESQAGEGSQGSWAGELVTVLNRSVRAALITRWHGRELITWTLGEELSQERSSHGRTLSRSVPDIFEEKQGPLESRASHGGGQRKSG